MSQDYADAVMFLLIITLIFGGALGFLGGRLYQIDKDKGAKADDED